MGELHVNTHCNATVESVPSPGDIAVLSFSLETEDKKSEGIFEDFEKENICLDLVS